VKAKIGKYCIEWESGIHVDHHANLFSFGHAFLFDTASSVGEISGHSKAINSVAIRPGRPLRAVTVSDDMTVNFYHGVPFKFNKSMNHHSRFVQCVRYSPNGNNFVTCGMDSKVQLGIVTSRCRYPF
jgi:WD40 repeat protein